MKEVVFYAAPSETVQLARFHLRSHWELITKLSWQATCELRVCCSSAKTQKVLVRERSAPLDAAGNELAPGEVCDLLAASIHATWVEHLP